MKKLLILISLLLCITLVFTGCGGATKQADSDNEASEEKEEDTEKSESDDDTEEVVQEDSEDVQEAEEDSGDTQPVEEDSDENEVSSSDLTCITDFSDYWSNVYEGNEEVINSYEGMPVMEIFYAGVCFITGVQYDILNINNVDGHFEGELILSGYQGYVDKKGSEITFGYENVLEEDGFTPSDLKGDKQVESGNCNLADGYYFSESYTERNGAVIGRTVNELKIEDDGGISSLVLEGRTLNYSNEEELSNTYTFVRNGKNQYDFVVAKAQIGTDFKAPSLEKDMTKEKAITMFEAAGFTIESSGGIANGVYALD